LLEKASSDPHFAEIVNGISKIGWSVNEMSIKQGRPWCYIGKWEVRVAGGTSRLEVTKVMDGATSAKGVRRRTAAFASHMPLFGMHFLEWRWLIWEISVRYFENVHERRGTPLGRREEKLD
jgi:hypothetical protein